MIMQSPMISGSITVKNLSFEGKLIIKALLEQGINVDIDGENLRIGSRSIGASKDFNSQRDVDLPVVEPGHSDIAVDSNYCPFYSKIEYFSRKLDNLSEILRNQKVTRDFSRDISFDNNIFTKSRESYYDHQYPSPKESHPRKNPVWPLPRDDMRKTSDFLARQRSNADFPSFFSAEADNTKKTCSQCGLQLSKNSLFCYNCGKEIQL
ncbi:MAG: zinc ribbon domain-containing protein [Candidatus Hodarchaeales archaeon]